MQTNNNIGEVALSEIRKCLHQEGLTKIERRWAAYGVWRLWAQLQPIPAIEARVSEMMEEMMEEMT